MKMVTFGPININDGQISAAVAGALKELGEKPRLAVIYPPVTADIAAISKTIKKAVDCPLIGATTGGAGFTERGIALNALVGAFISGDDVIVQSMPVKDLKQNIAQSLKKNLDTVKPGPKPGHTLFVLADPLSCDGEQLIKEMAKLTPVHWRYLGGFAGDNWTFKGVKLIHDNDIFSGGAILTYINSDIAPAMSARHGFCPVEGSREMRITSNTGNVIHTIDDQPAVEMYRSELERLNLSKKGDDIISNAARFPLGVKTILGEKMKIRTPMAIEGTDLVLAGSLQKGDRIQLMFGTTANMIAAAKEMTETTIKGLKGATPRLQLVIDCAGRKVLLGEQYKDQIKALRVDAHIPMLGFTSYGEIARYGGSLEGFHNTTAVNAVW